MKKFIKISSLILIIVICFSCRNNSKTTETKIKDKKETVQLPNVVFILSDDQSWTDYGFMGHEQIETPRLDEFASESLTFTRGYVPTPLCSPSLASIITGVYPKDHGILGNDVAYNRTNDKVYNRKLRNEKYKPMITHFERLTTLPDLLKEKGYLSFQTGKWWHGNYRNGGFDYGMTHGDPNRGGRHGDYGLEIGRKGMDTLSSYVDLAIKEEKPFFLWYAPFLPHSPHTPPQRLLDKYLPTAPTEYVAKYWAMCEWFDETCGELFDIIDEKGLTENTLFVYVCDNGWVQNLDNSSYKKNSKRSPYDLGMRTPIMYKWAGEFKPKIDSMTIVSSIDIVPTVLDILNIDKSENLSGISVLDEKALHNREEIYGEIYAHDFTTVDSSLFYTIAIAPPYKMIVPDSVRKQNEKIQLFNIDVDPFEKNDIAEKNPKVVEDLKEKIKAFRSE